MESAMTMWTAVASSVADQGRKLAAAAGPTCATAAEPGRQACSCAAEVGRQAGTVAWKLTRSTGKAAWIFGTSVLVLVVPIVILESCEDHAQHNQQMELLNDASYLLGGRTA